MNQSISTTHEYLLANYGPLLTFKHLAEVMHSSPNGVRMAIARKRQPLAIALSDARQQLGRRVYFKARLVADAIDCSMTDLIFEPVAGDASTSVSDHAHQAEATQS